MSDPKKGPPRKPPDPKKVAAKLRKSLRSHAKKQKTTAAQKEAGARREAEAFHHSVADPTGKPAGKGKRPKVQRQRTAPPVDPGARLRDLAGKDRARAATAPPPPGGLVRFGRKLNEYFGKATGPLGKVKRGAATRSKTRIDVSQGVNEHTGSPHSEFRRKVGEFADRILRKGTKGETQAERGFRIPGEKPKKKGFDPTFRKTEETKGGLHGLDWLLDKEKEAEHGHATKLKAKANVSLPLLVAALAGARLEHIKKKDPKRYQKERKVALAGASVYGGYQTLRLVRNRIRQIHGIAKEL